STFHHGMLPNAHAQRRVARGRTKSAPSRPPPSAAACSSVALDLLPGARCTSLRQLLRPPTTKPAPPSSPIHPSPPFPSTPRPPFSTHRRRTGVRVEPDPLFVAPPRLLCVRNSTPPVAPPLVPDTISRTAGVTSVPHP